MCILFIAVNQHRDYPLIIAANRDEFTDRPTRSSGFWNEHPGLLAGKDLKAGGTWMGINTQGKVAALTNVRDPQKIDPDARSRGELVTDFLTDDSIGNQTYFDKLSSTKDRYNGYNLLFGHWRDLWVYNNHKGSLDKLKDGVYGLSNDDLNSPWPKINKGMLALEDYCHTDESLDSDHLFDLLRDKTQAQDKYLPQTGVPIEWERKLSSIFISAQGYATRSSTLLLIDQQGQVSWEEHSYDPDGKCFEEKNFQFSLS